MRLVISRIRSQPNFILWWLQLDWYQSGRG
jgi:hypothetical protein